MIEETNYKFEPSQELLKLANSFSEQWRFLSIGNYCSNDKKYNIEYLDNIIDSNGIKSVNNIRINIRTGVIQISKNNLIEYKSSNNYIFFMILWCIIELDVRNYYSADKIALEYYKNTDRSMRDIIEGYIRVFRLNASHQNVERMRKISELTKLKEPNKNRIRILL